MKKWSLEDGNAETARFQIHSNRAKNFNKIGGYFRMEVLLKFSENTGKYCIMYKPRRELKLINIRAELFMRSAGFC